MPKKTSLGGLEYEVELNLDKLRKGQTEIIKSLRKLDPAAKKAEKDIKKVETSFDKLKKTAGNLGIAIGAAFVLDKVKQPQEQMSQQFLHI